MIGCLTGFLSRLIFLGIWIWTPLVSLAFSGNWIVPLLGVLFLPCMALVYVWAYAPGIGVTGWGWVWVVVAFLVDVSAHGSGARRAVRRRNKSASLPA
ncbi:MAG TPA: hypothetical protein VH599_17300 [Ktedonobacterales bacterium]